MALMLFGRSVQLPTLSTASVSVTLLPEPVASRLLTAAAWLLATADAGAAADVVGDCDAAEGGGVVDVLDDGDGLGADADEAAGDVWDGGRDPWPDGVW